MNTFFIRTRLQCLIATHIQKNILKNQDYKVVFLYQNSKQEDHDVVYKTYQDFEKRSVSASHIVIGDGLYLGFFKAFFACLNTAITRGSCFVASIDSLPVALGVRIFPYLRLETFDDGAANILKSSKYFSNSLDSKSGIRGLIGKILFPNGWARWMREKSSRHHTIYPNHSNIVNRKRINTLDWNWSDLLIDTDLPTIDMGAINIVLGSTLWDPSSPHGASEVVNKIIEKADLYIRHPRESSEQRFGCEKTFQSPAESILCYFSNKNKINIFHFNSSVSYALSGHENIHFINMTDPNTFELCITNEQYMDIFNLK